MLNKNRLKFVVTSIVAALAVSATAASADVVVERTRAERRGLLIGIGVGAGHMECTGSGCESVNEAGGAHLQLGTMITPRMAIVGDIWGMAHRDDRVTLTHMMATVGPQIWLLPRFWIRAGVGGARAGFTYDITIADIDDRTNTVLGIAGAAGLELVSSPTFGLDLQLRAGTGFFEDEESRIDNFALAFGANWY